MKVQTAPKRWDAAPAELIELRKLLIRVGYEVVNWSPKRLGINLLTPNKIRGIILKRVLMKLYPFDLFWITDTLDETLHKCLLVCQQLELETDRTIVWGQCSMNASYDFWKTVMKTVPRKNKSISDEEYVYEAKNNVISALMKSRGTDWDKQIARNFEHVMGNSRVGSFIKSHKSVINLAQSQQSKFQGSNSKQNHFASRPSSRPGTGNPHKFEENVTTSADRSKLTTTTSLARELKKESQDMEQILKSIEKYYKNDCVLQIGNAFRMSTKVVDLASEFEGYMTANNRGAFKDVESLTNHTDKVIRALSKLAAAYSDFFLEFQKYFRNGQGDELSLSSVIAKLGAIASEK